jgi:hypothetical protein
MTGTAPPPIDEQLVVTDADGVRTMRLTGPRPATR